MPNMCLGKNCNQILLDDEGVVRDGLRLAMKNGTLGIECPECHTFNIVRARPKDSALGATVFDIDGVV
jgi:hypothetical protein